MDFEADAKNVRGLGVTYFHEHGHLIDYAAGQIPASITTKSFLGSLQNDYKQYIINYQIKHGLSNIKDVYDAVSKDLRGNDALSSVSDIMGGLSGNAVRGDWGHSKAYWARNPDMIAIESFAHLFEAQFDGERFRLFSEYFPTAATEFQKILGGLL
jgi:hypothetical protein